VTADPGTLLLRADAGADLGAGHAMRCLSLAQAWQDAGGRAVLAAAELPERLAARFRREAIDVVALPARDDAGDGAATAALARRHAAAWVVTDGHRFGPEHHAPIKAAGLPLLAIDDEGDHPAWLADVVLNQNLHATPALYGNAPAGTRRLLGPRWALLRRDFAKQRDRGPTVAGTRRVLATLGGGDPGPAGRLVGEALALVRAADVTVVVGPADPRPPAALPSSARVERDPADMAALMADADVVVAGGGTTCWELACLGAPAVVVTLADNQVPVARALAAAGAVVNLGDATACSAAALATAVNRLLDDPATRAAMAAAGRALVDGAGAGRVVMLLRGERLGLRRIEAGDARQLWEWANDPDVRRASFSPAPIPWDDHVRWLAARLTDPRWMGWMATDAAGISIGQLRFEVDGADATLSVSLDRAARGRGLGRVLIDRGCRDLLQTTVVERVHAWVKPDNAASAAAFAAAGFVETDGAEAHDPPARHFVRRREGTPA
jgi:UDP-2,4-diacetamido-2,4,6-trideoxy-beta-L-altropyranose hydrolase